ncbi:T9SS type A sorting domain-containing protein [Flavobacterium sp.]|uniref:dioxygenase family protein n=1 Tax=Flavobacterium sp. TaxID=239 RepID=UPI00260AED41|nr:T9SS type A sorting domain-containing protein [Flavobacterium sp.]
MERKEFLRKSIGILGMAVVAPSLLRASQKDTEVTVCSVTNSETAGPFPTHTPASLSSANIVSDRQGIPMTVNITINNTNGNCTGLAGAIVDIWHCDKDGYYSEYGGSGMQTVDFTAVHFLRGRQVTDANGLVTFTSIYPGWYSGRATHIHVHVYNAAGTSLLVTQIAFPEGTNSATVQVNASTANGYTKGMTGYTYNASDNVFSDGVTNELGTVTGSVAAGYTLNHTIFVAGPTLGLEEINYTQNQVSQNFPNPFIYNTTIQVMLVSSSKVLIEIYDISGKHISTPVRGTFPAGTNNINLDRSSAKLSSGHYIYKVTISNNDGTFTENKKMLVQ